MTIAIDFDGVLMNPEDVEEGRRMGKPVAGATTAMWQLDGLGHHLVIFTVRGGRPEHVKDWLNHYHIPFDEVTNIKPDADLFLDDRALRFVNWTQALVEIGACAENYD